MATKNTAATPKLLSRDDIFRVVDVHTEIVDVPEWGGAVKVRGMTGRERDQYEQSMLVADKKGTLKPDMTDARARLVVACAVNEDGSPLFADKGDVLMLSMKSAAALDRVSSVASVLSGISDRDLEDLVKNSGSDQSDDSGSA